MQFDMRSARVTLVADTGAVLPVFQRDRTGEVRSVGTRPGDATPATAKDRATP
jgi:hypothetical protein